MKKIAIFASGKGSNAANLIAYFKEKGGISVGAIFTNNPAAGVVDISVENDVPIIIFNRSEFKSPEFLRSLERYDTDLIVLAGFLWLLPKYLIDAYPKRIVNIHPALLPKYGGKGMYGKYVHEAVKAAADTVTGITIHYVDEHYDQGDIILQKSVALSPDDTAVSIGEKVQRLEHEWYPRVVEELVLGTGY